LVAGVAQWKRRVGRRVTVAAAAQAAEAEAAEAAAPVKAAVKAAGAWR